MSVCYKLHPVQATIKYHKYRFVCHCSEKKYTKLNFWIGSSGKAARARQGLSYPADEIVRFFYCKTNDRSQQPHESENKIIFACYFARQKLKLNMFSG